MWDNFFASYTSDKGLVYRIHKELKSLNIKEANNSVKMVYGTEHKVFNTNNANGQ